MIHDGHAPIKSVLSPLSHHVTSALAGCAGILNLMCLVLICANARLIMENLMKYGILLNPTRWLTYLLPDGERHV